MTTLIYLYMVGPITIKEGSLLASTDADNSAVLSAPIHQTRRTDMQLGSIY